MKPELVAEFEDKQKALVAAQSAERAAQAAVSAVLYRGDKKPKAGGATESLSDCRERFNALYDRLDAIADEDGSIAGSEGDDDGTVYSWRQLRPREVQVETDAGTETYDVSFLLKTYKSTGRKSVQSRWEKIGPAAAISPFEFTESAGESAFYIFSGARFDEAAGQLTNIESSLFAFEGSKILADLAKRIFPERHD